jgi:hypothetical protein
MSIVGVVVDGDRRALDEVVERAHWVRPNSFTLADEKPVPFLFALHYTLRVLPICFANARFLPMAGPA